MNSFSNISDLFKIQNNIRELSNEQFEIIVNLYQVRYNFKNKNLQKEIGVEKIKLLFLQFMKKQKKFNKRDTLILKKLKKVIRNNGNNFEHGIVNNFDMLKHMINYIPDNQKTFMLKALYLLNK